MFVSMEVFSCYVLVYLSPNAMSLAAPSLAPDILGFGEFYFGTNR